MYKYIAAKKNPLSLWMLDDTTPFQDYSGRSILSAVRAGTVAPGKAAALVADAAYAAVFSKDAQAEHTAPVFVQGREADPFALEAWLYPIAKTEGHEPQPYRENQVYNPVPANLTGWGSWPGSGASTLTHSTTGGRLGGPHARATWTADSISRGDISVATAANTAKEGDVVSASAWVRTSVAKVVELRIQWQNSFGSSISTAGVSTVSIPANIWTYIKFDNLIAPAGTNRFKVYASGTFLAGEYIDMCYVLGEKAPVVGNYFDGSFAGYEWLATANNSISRTKVDVSNVSLPTNPSFETNLNAWSGINSTIAQSTDWADSGSNSMKITPTGITDSFAQIGGSTNNLVGMIPGETYTITATIRLGAAQVGNLDATRARRIVIYSWNSGTLVGASTMSPAAANAAGVTRVSLNYTVPLDGVNGVTIRLYNGAALDGGDVYWDSFSIVRGANNSTYFDGSTIGAGWSGAAHGSHSFMYISEEPQQIASHSGRYDGLTVDGTVVSFATEYLTAGRAVCSYDLQHRRAVHAVGVHDASKNELYIDGELVASVDLTPDQKADSYIATDGKLYSGFTNSSQHVALNGVAVYTDISPDDIKSNFIVGRNVFGQDYTVSGYGGEALDLTGTNEYLVETWLDKNDFNQGLLNNVSVSDYAVTPAFASGVSVAGSWTTVVPLETGGLTSIYGVTVDWSGSGVTVEASLNGTTWSPVLRGRLLSLIPNGFNPSNADLQIRVSFTGGRSDDSEFLESLTVTGYNGNTITKSLTRSMTVTYPAVVRGDYEPILHDDRNGIRLDGGTLTIDADTDTEAPGVRTLEVWHKVISGGLGRPGGANTQMVYYNGGNSTTTTVGEWTLLHVVFLADHVGSISLSGNVIVGQVALYPTSLTAAEVSDIYRSYVGYPVYRVAEDGVISIVEGADPVKTYDYNWSITGAGG